MKAVNFEIDVLGNIVEVNIESGNITEKKEFLMNNLPKNADPVRAWENKKKTLVLTIKKYTEDGLIFNIFIDEDIVKEGGFDTETDFINLVTKLSLSDHLSIELLKEFYFKNKEDIKLSELLDGFYVDGTTYHDIKIAIQMELLSNLEY